MTESVQLGEIRRPRTNLQGRLCLLRALEPDDLDLLYSWENDPSVWGVSGTIAPFSRVTLRRLIDSQQFDIYQTRQLRLVIGAQDGGHAVGLVDLYEFDPMHLRAGVGILVHALGDRGRGYASDAVAVLAEYARDVLMMKQLWCNVAVTNEASMQLFRHAGFEVCGLKKSWNRTPDGWVDEATLQLLLR